MVPKTYKSAFIIILLFLILTPSLLFAADIDKDPNYDAAGLSSNRDPLSLVPYEHIDTFTGGVTLAYVDLQLPGKY